MNKSIKIILIVIIVILLSISLAMLIKKAELDRAYSHEISITPKPSIAPPALPFKQENEILKVGSIGVDVIRLQKRLIELKYLDGKADGKFGNGTKEALIDFQQSNQLSADGIAGDNTLKLIYSDKAKPKK